MAAAPLWGTDATIATTGFGCHYNAFSINISQGTTSSYGYGDTWIRNHGTLLGATGSISGFTDNGATTDAPGLAAAFTRSGSSLTLTWKSGNTLGLTAVFSGLGMDNSVTGTPTSAYSFVADGAVTETWTTS